MASNASDGAELLRGMGTGLLVTELMGQGVNTITGDYSRGAAGFWVEGGEIRHAVDEVTIAGNLRDMFQVDRGGRRRHRPPLARLVGSLLVGRMTVAGDLTLT